MRFASCVIIFQEILQSMNIIALCSWQQSLALHNRVPSPQVWVINQVVANILGLVVRLCVLNQSKGYWFFSHALIVTIPLICQMQVENLTLNSNETQDFNGEFKILEVHMH
jgi:hypothetical protein